LISGITLVELDYDFCNRTELEKFVARVFGKYERDTQV